MTKDEIVTKAMQTFEDSNPQLPYDERWKLAFDAVWEDLAALHPFTTAGNGDCAVSDRALSTDHPEQKVQN